MKQYYECKVKYLHIDQGGYERKATANCLLSGINYTDAESKIYKKMQEHFGTFEVANIKKSNIAEAHFFENGEFWVKVKIQMISIDDETGKEKKISELILVMANNLEQALERVDKKLSYLLVPYEKVAVQISNITEVFEDEDN